MKDDLCISTLLSILSNIVFGFTTHISESSQIKEPTPSKTQASVESLESEAKTYDDANDVSR